MTPKITPTISRAYHEGRMACPAVISGSRDGYADHGRTHTRDHWLRWARERYGQQVRVLPATPSYPIYIIVIEEG